MHKYIIYKNKTLQHFILGIVHFGGFKNHYLNKEIHFIYIYLYIDLTKDL